MTGRTTGASNRGPASSAVKLALALCLGLAACAGEGAREAPAERAVREAVREAAQDSGQLTRTGADSGSAARQPSAVSDACGRPVIDGEGVGGIRLGMEVDTVKAHCAIIRDTVELRSEGQAERILVAAFGDDTVTVEVDSARVWRIEITDPGLRTADWLGVGTPLSALLALKGGKQGLTGEGNLFVITEARCGLSFELSEPRSPSGAWPVERLRTLPKSTVVKRVLVVGCRNWGSG